MPTAIGLEGADGRGRAGIAARRAVAAPLMPIEAVADTARDISRIDNIDTARPA